MTAAVGRANDHRRAVVQIFRTRRLVIAGEQVAVSQPAERGPIASPSGRIAHDHHPPFDPKGRVRRKANVTRIHRLLLPHLVRYRLPARCTTRPVRSDSSAANDASMTRSESTSV